MSNATDFLEAAVGNALFLAQPLLITQWTVHLFSTAPNDAGLNGVEIPAGAKAHHDEAEALMEMSDSNALNSFMGKSPEQIRALLERAL